MCLGTKVLFRHLMKALTNYPGCKVNTKCFKDNRQGRSVPQLTSSKIPLASSYDGERAGFIFLRRGRWLTLIGLPLFEGNLIR